MNMTVFTLFLPLPLFPSTLPTCPNPPITLSLIMIVLISLSLSSPLPSLLSSFNVVFRAGHWRIHNLSSILTGENRFSLSSLWLPVGPHQGVGSCDIAPICVGISTGVFVMQILFEQPYCWGFSNIACLWCLEHSKCLCPLAHTIALL